MMREIIVSCLLNINFMLGHHFSDVLCEISNILIAYKIAVTLDSKSN